MFLNHLVNFPMPLSFSRFSAAFGQIRPAAIIIIIQTLTFFPVGESRFLWQESIHISTNAYIEMVACICIKLEKEKLSEEDKGITRCHCLSLHPSQGDQDYEDLPPGLPVF